MLTPSIKLITLLANIVILYFVFNLKNNDCKCSKNTCREYIFYYSIIHIFLTAIMFIVPQFFDLHKNMSIFLKFVLGTGMILNVYCLYTYSQQLKGCNCSSENFRIFMEYYSFFYMIVLIFIHLYLYDFYVKNKNLRTILVGN